MLTYAGKKDDYALSLTLKPQLVVFQPKKYSFKIYNLQFQKIKIH